MTSEERLNRIEHVTAGIAEERRRDREEYRQLWRDQRRQIDELNRAITRFAEESRAAYVRCHEDLEEWRGESRKAAEESRAADKLLGERIDSLVSAMGKSLAANEQWREESRAADKRLGERIDGLVSADKRLGERIDSLVSAMGKFLAELPKPRNAE